MDSTSRQNSQGPRGSPSYRGTGARAYRGNSHRRTTDRTNPHSSRRTFGRSTPAPAPTNDTGHRTNDFNWFPWLSDTTPPTVFGLNEDAIAGLPVRRMLLIPGRFSHLLLDIHHDVVGYFPAGLFNPDLTQPVIIQVVVNRLPTYIA
jgi:hypothetical protein